MQFIGWFKGGKLEHIPLAAEDFLAIMSDLAVGWLLLDQATIALKKLSETSETHPDHAFYTGKKFAAQYFANNVLTTLPSRTQRLSADRHPSCRDPRRVVREHLTSEPDPAAGLTLWRGSRRTCRRARACGA